MISSSCIAAAVYDSDRRIIFSTQLVQAMFPYLQSVLCQLKSDLKNAILCKTEAVLSSRKEVYA